MIIEGEKWACEACVRGHRVSNCQHSDRPLQHINKKGRPVSQCQHCRAMRKSRSAHIKCDCGEKTSKCHHLQPAVDGHNETCCCNHGGRCSCAHKKDMQPTLDPVPESDSEGDGRNKTECARPKLVARRRRAATIHSDGMLSFDQHGNRKSTTKVRPAQKIGPYQLNRNNSGNSTTSMGSETIAEARVRQAMGVERRVKSEAASPMMSGTGFQQLNGHIPPLDLSRIEYPTYMANSSFDLFGAGFSPDHDGPMYSAGLSAQSVDWNAYEFPTTYGQSGAPTFSSYADFASTSEQLPTLANTTSTSGDVSEVEDYMPNAEKNFNTNVGYMRANMVGNNADISTIDYDSFYKGPEQTVITAPGMSMVEEDPAFWMPNYHEGMIDESPDPLGPNTMGNFWEV